MHKEQTIKDFIYNVELKDYNIMIDGKSFFDWPVKTNKVTYQKIRKITTGCLLEYIYFKNY